MSAVFSFLGVLRGLGGSSKFAFIWQTMAFAVVLLVVLQWLFGAAVERDRLERELQSERATSNVLRNSVEETDAVNSLDDDALRDALMRRVPGPR